MNCSMDDIKINRRIFILYFILLKNHHAYVLVEYVYLYPMIEIIFKQ